jgi:DNA repair protein RadC
MTRLYVQDDTGFREATNDEIIASAQTLISQRFRTGTPVTHFELAADYVRLHIGLLEYEVFGVIHLDTRHRVITVENMFRGTMDRADVSIREIAQSVLAYRSAAVILYHNHPSGLTEPSTADTAITARIRRSLDLIEVKVLDHLIIGKTVFSFAQNGLL